MRSVRSRRRCDGCVARVRCAAQQRQAKSRAHDIFARGVGALHGSWKPTSKMASAQLVARAVKHDGEQQGKGRVDREQDETRIFPVRNKSVGISGSMASLFLIVFDKLVLLTCLDSRGSAHTAVTASASSSLHVNLGRSHVQTSTVAYVRCMSMSIVVSPWAAWRPCACVRVYQNFYM